MFRTVRRIHFVGIGGIGMSAIAEILINQGFEVSGSDLNSSDNTDYLQNIGATIILGHDGKNVHGAEVVVYSSAVNLTTNPETLEAVKLKIPLLRRAEMLAEVARLNYCLAISGTHGKTTTTSIIGLILIKAGIDPTVIVGGRLRGLGGTNARLGHGDWTVVEADEFDRSFLQLSPTIAVVNNIEEEHLDIYSGYEDLISTFTEFVNKVPFYGFASVGLDDPGVKDMLTRVVKKIVTFGISRNCDYRAEDIISKGRSTTFKAIQRGEELGVVTLNIPGEHNVKNALAAISVARELNIDFGVIAEAITEFSGVYRRFEIKGEKDGVLVVDDYAHHQTEISATLSAARNGWKRRIVAVFQPHTYSRTQNFYKEFAKSFDDADVLVVTDIYPAREKPIEGITGELIAETAKKYGHKNVIYIKDFDSLFEEVPKLIQSGDILITLGAGNIWKLAESIVG